MRITRFRGPALSILAASLLSVISVAPALAQFDRMQFGTLGPGDHRKSDQQRELVRSLTLRHLGERIQGNSRSDLELLQRLLDERVLDAEHVFELQAMGVMLGDVMVAALGLHWVVVDDKFGHSRALRWRESQEVFFPITMISKRVEGNQPVDVAALYAKVEAAVARLRARSD